MYIRTKMSVLQTVLLLAVFAGIFGMLYTQVAGMINGKDMEVYGEKLTKLLSHAQTNYDAIKEAGLDDVESYRASAQEEALSFIAEVNAGKNAADVYAHVISADGKVVLYPGLSAGAADLAGTEFVKRMIGSQARSEQWSTVTGKRVWSLYDYFAPWQWHVGYSVTQGYKYAQINGFVIILSVTLLVFLVIMSTVNLLAVSRLVSRPLKKLGDAIKRIAGGDLAARVQIRAKDELGIVGAGFNEMTDQLRGMVVEIRQTSEKLAGSSAQIAASSHQLAANSQGQASTLEETSAAVEELTSSVEQVSEHAQSQAESATHAAGGVQEMRASTEQVSLTLQDVSASSEASITMARAGVEAVNDTVSAIRSISENAEHIGGIVNVISEIADQTNLLALNASIEAARAGEHGRGFAVVAQEVSKLAERSASSTREIEQLIQESLKNVTRGVDVARHALDSMNMIISGTQKTNQAVSELSNRIESQVKAIVSVTSSNKSINDMAQSISAATEEQTINAQQVSRAVENVNDLTQEAASAASQMSNATVELTELAKKLQGLVETFNLGAGQEQDAARIPIAAA